MLKFYPLFFVAFFSTNLLLAAAPVAICQAQVNYALPYDDCEATILPEYIDAGSYDPDGDAVSLSIWGTNTFGLGTHTVYLRVTDGTSSNYCWTTILVEDKNVPTASCNDGTYTVADPETLDLDQIVNSLSTVSTACFHAWTYDLLERTTGYDYEVTVINWSSSETVTCSGTITINDGEPQTYCNTAGVSNYEHIARVKVEGVNCDIDRTSGNDGGYHYEPAYGLATLHNGYTYTLTYKPGFAYNPFLEYWRVYIDLNRDGDFIDAGELVHSRAGYGEHTTTFTVPSSGTGWGYTRMRVVMKYGGYGSSCDNGNYGEVEDYSVYVGPYIWWWWFRNAPPADLGTQDLATINSRSDEPVRPGEAARRLELTGETVDNTKVNVYPNPARIGGLINATFPAATKRIVLRNILGRVIRNYDAQSELEIPANLPAGTYLLSGVGAQGNAIWSRKLQLR